MSKPSNTNYPNGFLAMDLYLISGTCQVIPGATDCIARYSHGLQRHGERSGSGMYRECISLCENVLLGGYSSEVPPLPIPNREVKLTNADGTAVIPWESR